MPTWCYKGAKKFHYYRCSKTQKNMVDDCKIKNISASVVEHEVFMSFSKTLNNEFFLQSLAADCNLSVEQLRGPAKALAEDVMRMTDAQRKRVAEQMFRQVEIRRDGVDLILWGEGLVRYFTKGIKK